MSKTKDLNDRLLDGTFPADLHEGAIVSDDVPVILTVKQLLAGAHKRSISRERQVYGTTGHHRLDAITGGLRPGDCWLVGADTSWGKSSFAIMLADENIRIGKRVLIMSSEDSEQTYGDRLMCRRSRVPAQALRDRRMSPEQHNAVADVMARAEDLPVFIDARGRTVEWLAPRCKEAIVAHNIDVVIFDYIGAFAGKLQQQDRRNMVTYIGRVLTDVAKTAKPGGICGVLLSQLTHGDETAVPGKYSIRDSKNLVQMSEVCLIGFLAPKDDPEHDVRAGDRVMKVAKCKQGQNGATCVMTWDSSSACFDAVADPYALPAAEEWVFDNE